MHRSTFLLASALVLAFVLVASVAGSARAEDQAASTAAQDELAEVAFLKQRGGHLAVHRLHALLEAGTPTVRLRALDALAHIGLRSEDAVGAVRRALETPDVEERKTALRTLGRIGDGRDVEALLGALREEDGGVSATAVQALRDLTGRRLPVSPTRCSMWWRSSARGMRSSLHTALDAVANGNERQVEAALATLARDGWVELDTVSEAARDWLRATDHDLRAAGFRLAAALRLADLASDVESTLPFVSAVDAEAGLAAAKVLGLSSDLLPPVWRRRLQVRTGIAR